MTIDRTEMRDVSFCDKNSWTIDHLPVEVNVGYGCFTPGIVRSTRAGINA
jgi:hypothetical protein